LYSFSEKRLVVVLLVMLNTLLLQSQEDNIILDSIQVPGFFTIPDSTRTLLRISTDAIDKKVTYSAPGGYIFNDLVNKKATIVKNGIVNYGDIEIKADSIVFDMETSEVYAVGIYDSLGTITGKPEFKSGSEAFKSDTLRYNFKTKMAIVKEIVTEQDEGYLRSEVTKLIEDGKSNVYKKNN